MCLNREERRHENEREAFRSVSDNPSKRRVGLAIGTYLASMIRADLRKCQHHRSLTSATDPIDLGIVASQQRSSRWKKQLERQARLID